MRQELRANSIVRCATAEDAAAIAEVHVRSWQIAYRGQLPDELLDNLSVERRTLWWADERWRSRADRRSLLVAQVASEIVGFAATGPSRDADAGGDVGEVLAIYVHPSNWGQGFGQALMERSLYELRADGFGIATLWVLEPNQRARRFYELGGWEADGTHRTERLHEGGPEAVETRYRRHL